MNVNYVETRRNLFGNIVWIVSILDIDSQIRINFCK